MSDTPEGFETAPDGTPVCALCGTAVVRGYVDLHRERHERGEAVTERPEWPPSLEVKQATDAHG